MEELNKEEAYFHLGIMLSVVVIAGFFSYYMAVLALTLFQVFQI